VIDATSIQIIETPDGEPSFAAVPIETYRAMLRDLEAYHDLKTGMRELTALEARADALPADVAHRIADGDNPVRVWRDHRGLKAVTLARNAGISPAYLSEIETGKKEGTFKTMALLARHLGITLDDLAPLADHADTERLRREGREAALRAEIAAIRAAIASGAFDSSAVRAAAARLERDTAALVTDGADTQWAAELGRALAQIVALVDRAEQDIVQTARDAQMQLEKIMAFDAFSSATQRPPARHASRGLPARESPPPMAGE